MYAFHPNSNSHLSSLAIACFIVLNPGTALADQNATFWGGKVRWTEQTNLVMRGGLQTNSVALGLLFEPEGSRLSQHEVGFHVFLKNDSTNHIMLVLPDGDSAFALSLFDGHGNSIRRTYNGKRLGAILPRVKKADPRKTRELKRVWVRAKEATWFTTVNLLQYFQIEKPGKYRLEYEQRFYDLTDDWILNGIALPKATINVEIR